MLRFGFATRLLLLFCGGLGLLVMILCGHCIRNLVAGTEKIASNIAAHLDTHAQSTLHSSGPATHLRVSPRLVSKLIALKTSSLVNSVGQEGPVQYHRENQDLQYEARREHAEGISPEADGTGLSEGFPDVDAGSDGPRSDFTIWGSSVSHSESSGDSNIDMASNVEGNRGRQIGGQEYEQPLPNEEAKEDFVSQMRTVSSLLTVNSQNHQRQESSTFSHGKFCIYQEGSCDARSKGNPGKLFTCNEKVQDDVCINFPSDAAIFRCGRNQRVAHYQVPGCGAPSLIAEEDVTCVDMTEGTYFLLCCSEEGDLTPCDPLYVGGQRQEA
jgi:hypothetical protein